MLQSGSMSTILVVVDPASMPKYASPVYPARSTVGTVMALCRAEKAS